MKLKVFLLALLFMAGFTGPGLCFSPTASHTCCIGMQAAISVVCSTHDKEATLSCCKVQSVVSGVFSQNDKFKLLNTGFSVYPAFSIPPQILTQQVVYSSFQPYYKDQSNRYLELHKLLN